MDRRKVSGQFSNQDVSSSDLERGYMDTGYTPEVGENVNHPENESEEDGCCE